MTTASIDIDTLNKLFDNQKKLDDVFDSLFDDDFMDSPVVSYNDKAYENSGTMDTKIFNSNENYSSKAEDDFYTQKNRSIASLALPIVLEIAALYYAIMYFS